MVVTIMRWFQFGVIFIFAIFMGLMLIVTVVAFSRPSGNPGIDMARVQQMRYQHQPGVIAADEGR
jgi:hypothetical protein